MATRKDMRDSKKNPPLPSFFRTIVTNGSSRGLNLTEWLHDWETVRITILEDRDESITIIIEDVETLRA